MEYLRSRIAEVQESQELFELSGTVTYHSLHRATSKVEGSNARDGPLSKFSTRVFNIQITDNETEQSSRSPRFNSIVIYFYDMWADKVKLIRNGDQIRLSGPSFIVQPDLQANSTENPLCIVISPIEQYRSQGIPRSFEIQLDANPISIHALISKDSSSFQLSSKNIPTSTSSTHSAIPTGPTSRIQTSTSKRKSRAPSHYRYTPLSSLQTLARGSVNVYGVLLTASIPKPTTSPTASHKYSQTFTITDPSISETGKSIALIIFANDISKFPPSPHLGCLIRGHRFRIQMYNHAPQLTFQINDHFEYNKSTILVISRYSDLEDEVREFVFCSRITLNDAELNVYSNSKTYSLEGDDPDLMENMLRYSESVIPKLCLIENTDPIIKLQTTAYDSRTVKCDIVARIEDVRNVNDEIVEIRITDVPTDASHNSVLVSCPVCPVLMKYIKIGSWVRIANLSMSYSPNPILRGSELRQFAIFVTDAFIIPLPRFMDDALFEFFSSAAAVPNRELDNRNIEILATVAAQLTNEQVTPNDNPVPIAIPPVEFPRISIFEAKCLLAPNLFKIKGQLIKYIFPNNSPVMSTSTNFFFFFLVLLDETAEIILEVSGSHAIFFLSCTPQRYLSDEITRSEVIHMLDFALQHEMSLETLVVSYLTHEQQDDDQVEGDVEQVMTRRKRFKLFGKQMTMK